MSRVRGRVAKLEASIGTHVCRVCADRWCGVVFSTPSPSDYAAAADGTPGPLPPRCPSCDRRLPKLYVLPDRECWDAMFRSDR